MKKIALLTLCLTGLSALMVSCGSNNSSNISSGSNEVSSSETNTSNSTNTSSNDTSVVQQPALYDVMSKVALLRNYTYTMVDEIFDVTTQMKYTEKAFYYQPSKEQHGGQAYGYAQSNDNEVFSYVIEDGEVVPGEVERNTNGEIKKDLWNESILSFYDFNIEAFAKEATPDNKYVITDSANKFLFASLAGYGDGMTLEYVTVTVEVTSDTSFVTTVNFNTGSSSAYNGNCICTLEDIGTTTLPEIEAYLEKGLGPKDDINADDLYAVLNSIKQAKKYQIEVTTETTHYLDVFNDEYYYSYDQLNSGKEKGYAKIGDRVYSIKMKDNVVSIDKEVDYAGSSSRDIWELNLFKNFSNINLSNLTFESLEDGKFKLTNNTSVLLTLYDLVHSSAFFGSVNVETDYAIFSDITETSFKYLLHVEGEADYEVTVSSIGTASNKTIEDFIENASSFDPEDISKLSEFFETLKASRNYTVTLEEKFSWLPSLEIGSSVTKFTENHIYYNNTEKPDSSMGYIDENGESYSYVLNGEEKEKVETFESSIWTVVNSFAQFDAATLTGQQNADGTYLLTSAETIKLIADICAFDPATFITYVTSMKVTFNTDSVVFTGSSSFYGSCTVTISNIGSTTL